MMTLTGFKPQLVGEGNAGIFLFNNEVAALEPKIDGIRIVLEKKGGSIRLYSRLMRDWTAHFKPIIKHLAEAIRFENCVLDGELAVIKKDRFTSSNYALRNKLGKNERFVYFVFDILEVENAELAREDFLTRKSHLYLGIEPNEHIAIVPHTIVNNEEDLNLFYARLLEKGFEGIVLKNLGPYSAGTRFNWLKKKPFETLDLKITSKEPRKDGKGWKYGLADNGARVSSVSSIINLEIGQIVEVKFEKKYPKGESYRLRFPQIIRSREDKE